MHRININNTIKYVIGELEKYDNDLAKGIIQMESPYTNTMYMEIDGKTIMIPYEIQYEAIYKWNVYKQNQMCIL